MKFSQLREYNMRNISLEKSFTNCDGQTTPRPFITQNLILLIFKFYVYKSIGSGNFRFSAFLHKLVKIKNLEKGTAIRN